LADLERIRERHGQADGFTPRNLFESETEKIVKEIQRLVDETRIVDFKAVQTANDEIKERIKDSKDKLKTYLSGKGLTEENLKDISDANSIVNNLDIEIKKKGDEIESLQRRID